MDSVNKIYVNNKLDLADKILFRGTKICTTLVLLVSNQINRKDCYKEQELDSDRFPVKVHGKRFSGVAAKHIRNPHIPVSRQEAGHLQQVVT